MVLGIAEGPWVLIWRSLVQSLSLMCPLQMIICACKTMSAFPKVPQHSLPLSLGSHSALHEKQNRPVNNWKVGSPGSNKPPRFAMGINTLFFSFTIVKSWKGLIFFFSSACEKYTNNLNPRVHAGTFLDRKGRISIKYSLK